MTGPTSPTASWAALLLLSLVLLLSLSPGAAEDFYGYVRFFDGREYSGESYYYYTSDSQYCVNLSCFDKKVSSVDWKNLPSEGTVDGKSKIAFFTERNCAGQLHEWEIRGVNNVSSRDLSIIDLDNNISSFMIFETSRKSKGNVLPCPWGFTLF